MLSVPFTALVIAFCGASAALDGALVLARKPDSLSLVSPVVMAEQLARTAVAVVVVGATVVVVGATVVVLDVLVTGGTDLTGSVTVKVFDPTEATVPVTVSLQLLKLTR